MAFLLEDARDRRRHLLLLRAILEVVSLREQPVLRKNGPHPLDKIAAEGIFERNHIRVEITRKSDPHRAKSHIRISKLEISTKSEIRIFKIPTGESGS